MYFNEIQMMLYYICTGTCSIIKKMLHVFYTWFMICLVGHKMSAKSSACHMIKICMTTLQ